MPDIYAQPENLDNFTDDNDAGFYYNSWKYKDGNLILLLPIMDFLVVALPAFKPSAGITGLLFILLSGNAIRLFSR